jgi:hypothetical protein
MASKKLTRYNSRSKTSHQSRSANLAENGLALRSRLVSNPDLLFENHLSLFLIRPVSPAGKIWLDDNVGDSETLTFGGATLCEPRFVEPIYRGAIEAGLVVRS